MASTDVLEATVSSEEEAAMPVNEQGIAAVAAGPPRRPFPPARREGLSEEERDALLHRELEASARVTAEEQIVRNFIEWFRDSVDDGRPIKPMQKYRKLALVLCACTRSVLLGFVVARNLFDQALVGNPSVGFTSVEDFDGCSIETLGRSLADEDLDVATSALLSRACRFYGDMRKVGHWLVRSQCMSSVKCVL